MKKIRNLTGKKFGKLEALKSFRRNKITYWLCYCDCGENIKVRQSNLISRNTKSCGCLNRLGIITTINRLFKIYKRNAKNRKIQFNLTFDQFKKLTSDVCFYCGISPQNTINPYITKKSKILHGTTKNSNYIKTLTYTYNGIDRLHNEFGYTYFNCVSCCKICNRAKDTLTKTEFLKWAERLWNHQKR